MLMRFLKKNRYLFSKPDDMIDGMFRILDDDGPVLSMYGHAGSSYF